MSAEPSSEDLRAETRRSWEGSAPHWGEAADRFARIAMPVTQALLDAARLQPGHRVLELGAGPGDAGVLAAELVRPAGGVLITDVAAPMVEEARRRAADAGAGNVAFAEVDAEAIPAEAASFDAVISRWGLMFPVDLEAAFAECRRVLRPGGRLSLAAWTGPEDNPWASEVHAELLDQGLIAPPPAGDRPGPFRLAAPGRLQALLAGAGFLDVRVEPLAWTGRFAGFEDFWAMQAKLSNAIRDALPLTNVRGAAAFKEGLAARMARFAAPDGSLKIPYSALMGVGEA